MVLGWCCGDLYLLPNRTTRLVLTAAFCAMVFALQLVDMPTLHFAGGEFEIEFPDGLALIAVALISWESGIFLGIVDGLGNLPFALAILPKSVANYVIAGLLASRLRSNLKWLAFVAYVPIDALTSALFLRVVYGVPVYVGITADAALAVSGMGVALLGWSILVTIFPTLAPV
jgi:hypothetical protein